MNVMLDRVPRTVLSFLIVLSAYWMYALFVVPHVEPIASLDLTSDVYGQDDRSLLEARPDSKLSHSTASTLASQEKPTERFRHLIEPIFAADSWELNQAMVLKNDQNKMMLLVGKYETANEGKRLKLKPCTVVINPESATTDAPPEQGGCLILTAPQGAELDFDTPFGIIQGGLGNLVGGRLVGEVSIRSHTRPQSRLDSALQPSHPLTIMTRNVQITPQQIWTPHEVRFRYGPNYGAGRDLIVKLGEIESTEIRRLPSENPTHLRSLELVHLDQLTVKTNTQSKLTNGSADEPATLNIRSKGPLLFDFVGGSVTLKDQVSIQRIAPTTPATPSKGSKPTSDWVTCDLLAMQFRAKRGATPDEDGTQTFRPQPQWQLPKFELVHISALGSPAVIDAPSYEVRAQAERIELHLSHNRILLQDTNQAVLRYGSHTFRGPRMKYFVDPQGGPGRAEVDSGGQYTGQFKDELVQLQWQNRLDFGPRDGKYLLEVDGRVHLQWGPLAANPTTPQPAIIQQLTAGQIQVWLRQHPANDQTLTYHSRDKFAYTAHTVEYDQSTTHQPDFQLNPPQVSAGASFAPGSRPGASATQTHSGQSQLNPPQVKTLPLNGAQQGPGSSPPVVADPSIPNSTRFANGWKPDRVVARKQVRLRTPQLSSDVEFAHIQFLDADADSAPDLGPALIDPHGRPSYGANQNEQYHLKGHEIHVELQDNTGPSALPGFRSVVIKGGVHLRQLTRNPQLATVEIQGTLVQLDQTDNGAIGNVTGEPAIVRTRGVEVTGRDIRVDQSENRVWIDDAGSAYIPLPQHVANRFSRKNATMQIAWQGSMVFDGEAVVCDQGVEIRGPAQIATAETLKATLAQPIHLNDLANQRRSSSSAPARDGEQVLGKVSLAGNVWLENRSFGDRGMASIEEFRVHSLEYEQSTGNLVGVGPGVISSVRYTKQKTSRQNAAATTTPKLTHTLIEFQKQLNGSLPKREISVFDQVRAIHGPVQNWQQRIRFDDDERSEETILMRAMRLTVAQMMTGGQPSLEFAASGNTEIEGKTFVARAQHVRYAQANDMLVMEGTGRSVAQLSHQSRVGAPRNNAAARKIQYLISENRLKIEGVVFGDVVGAGVLPNSATSTSPNPHYSRTPAASYVPNAFPKQPLQPKQTAPLQPQSRSVFGRFRRP